MVTHQLGGKDAQVSGAVLGSVERWSDVCVDIGGQDTRVQEGTLCDSPRGGPPPRGQFSRGPWEVKPCTFTTLCIRV